RAEAEATRAAHTPSLERLTALSPFFKGLTFRSDPFCRSFARSARRAGDHPKLARACAARQRLRGDAELLREPHREALALRREVHRGLRVREAVRSAHVLDRGAERLHAARELPRVVDVAAPVQDVHVHAPGRWEDNRIRRTVAATVAV